MIDIKASEFVKRQTRTSDFSYYNGPWEIVERMAMENFNKAEKGYRDGVILVPVCPAGFYASVVEIADEIEFETVYEARREGEEKFRKTVAYGKKQPATHVDVVLYHKYVLMEDENDRERLTGADWEIVSINARTTDKPFPMNPTTMARNILSCTDHPFGKGGSCDKNTTALQLAESIAFWKQHTTIRERE
jgi:hypothetical protein